MALTKWKSGKEYEVLRFPMKYLKISQGVNGGYSHAGANALDMCGKDSGIDPTFAPCKMKFMDSQPASLGNTVWFESVNPVLFADGTIDYATFMFIHDNYIQDIKNLAYQGHIFSQWEEFGDEGTAGQATGKMICSFS